MLVYLLMISFHSLLYRLVLFLFVLCFQIEQPFQFALIFFQLVMNSNVLMNVHIVTTYSKRLENLHVVRLPYTAFVLIHSAYASFECLQYLVAFAFVRPSWLDSFLVVA